MLFFSSAVVHFVLVVKMWNDLSKYFLPWDKIGCEPGQMAPLDCPHSGLRSLRARPIQTGISGWRPFQRRESSAPQSTSFWLNFPFLALWNCCSGLCTAGASAPGPLAPLKRRASSGSRLLASDRTRVERQDASACTALGQCFFKPPAERSAVAHLTTASVAYMGGGWCSG